MSTPTGWGFVNDMPTSTPAQNAARLAAMSPAQRAEMYRLQAENARKAAIRNGQPAPRGDWAQPATGAELAAINARIAAAQLRGSQPPRNRAGQFVGAGQQGGTGFSLSGNDVPGMNRTAAENAAYNAAKLAAMSQSERNTMYRLQAENAAKAAARNGTSMRDSIYGTPDPNSPGQRFGPPAYTGPQYGPPVSSSGTPWSTIPFVGNPVRTPYQTAPTYTPPATSNPNNYRPPNNYAGYTGPGYTPAQQQAPIYNPAGPPGADNPAQYRDPLYDSNGNWITGKTAQNSTPAPTGPTPTGPSPSTSGMTGSTPQYTTVRLGDDYFGYGTPPTGTNKYGTRAPKAWTDEQAAINWANYQGKNKPTSSPSTSGMTGSVQQTLKSSSQAPTGVSLPSPMQRDIADPTSPWYGYTLSSDGQVPRPPAPINYAAYNQPDQSNNYQQPRQPIPGSWADQMQQRTATRYPTTTAAGQINASSPADQRQQNITNSQATRTQAQIESQRITPEEIERNRISMEEQGPLFADQMAPYKEKSLSQGSGPARPTSKAWAPLTPEMQAEFDAYNAQQRAAAAAEKVRWDGVLAANKAANDARYGTGWDAPTSTGRHGTVSAPTTRDPNPNNRPNLPNYDPNRPFVADRDLPPEKKWWKNSSAPEIFSDTGDYLSNIVPYRAANSNTPAPTSNTQTTRPITPPPSRWPAPNQPDTSNNYQQPQLTYGPRQTADTGWVPSPQPQSSQFGFDYGPPPQMSDRVSRLAGAGAPAKVPAWMTAGNKQYLLQRNR